MNNTWWFAALFLPLFPFSTVFVFILRKISNNWIRSLVFLFWPQVGLFLLVDLSSGFPDFVIYWAVATAFLYALRSLVIRDVGLWLSYIAVSSWSLIWLMTSANDYQQLTLIAFAFSLPLFILTLLSHELEKRTLTNYSGLFGGIVQTQPRLAGLLVLAILAVAATPVFPSFFIMLTTIIDQLSFSIINTIGMLLVWLLWTWSGTRLMQGLVMGPTNSKANQLEDLSITLTAAFSIALVALVLFGFIMIGGF